MNSARRLFLDRLTRQGMAGDGAMGTELLARGARLAECLEEWNRTQASAVLAIHRDYLDAGAELLRTNTFGANRIRLRAHGLARLVGDLNQRGADLTRRVAGAKGLVVGTVGPLGVPVLPQEGPRPPTGDGVGWEEAKDVFREQIQVLLLAGVDIILCETFSSTVELRAAAAAVREVEGQRPLVLQFTAAENGALRDGVSPSEAMVLLEQAGADVVGCNCSAGPASVQEAVMAMEAVARIPVSAMPSAGLPGGGGYPVDAASFAAWSRDALAAGARLLGGCCGTTPSHIRALRDAVEAWRVTQG